MVTLVALVTDQLSLATAPAVMVAGTALNNCTAGFTFESITVTVAETLVEPPGPEAVKVYVVVDCGLTVDVPLVGRLLPTPWSIETAVAFVVDQRRVEV
jgi:hypothetical protein